MISDDRLKEIIAETGFSIGEKETDLFKKYYSLLTEKNKVMNLTAITEYDDVMIKHFADSILVKKVIVGLKKEGFQIKEPEIAKIADVGTGAGFPGVPIKICCPESEVVLIDSLNKRIKFLKELIGELGLNGISAVHGRCEDLGHNKEFRESFDLCFSRAVANLSVLVEYCLPLVKKGGFFVAYKSTDAVEEIKNANNAIKSLGGELCCVKKEELPGSDIERSFCVIKKTGHCPGKYPRQAGMPSKRPL